MSGTEARPSPATDAQPQHTYSARSSITLSPVPVSTQVRHGHGWSPPGCGPWPVSGLLPTRCDNPLCAAPDACHAPLRCSPACRPPVSRPRCVPRPCVPLSSLPLSLERQHSPSGISHTGTVHHEPHVHSASRAAPMLLTQTAPAAHPGQLQTPHHQEASQQSMQAPCVTNRLWMWDKRVAHDTTCESGRKRGP